MFKIIFHFIFFIGLIFGAMPYLVLAQELGPSGAGFGVKKHSVALYFDNDNLYFGIPQVLNTPDGNDVGFSHGLGIQYGYAKNENSRFQFDLMGALYLKSLPLSDELPEAVKQKLAVEPQWTSTRNETDGDTDAYYVDLLKWMLTYDHRNPGKLGFGYTIGFGSEIRDTDDATKMDLLRHAQDIWHKKITNIYRFRDIPSDGIQGEVIRTDENGTVYYSVDRPADAEIQKIKKYSILILLGISAAQKKQNFEFEEKVSFFNSTEGRRPIGPNSYFNAELNGKFRHAVDPSKKNRIVFEARASAQYFPKRIHSQISNFGAKGTLTLGSSHETKRKRRVEPFMIFYIPIGRQVFNDVNDLDVIQRTGVRYSF